MKVILLLFHQNHYPMEKKNLYSTQVVCSGRIFYFDVREAENANQYLVITEARKLDEGFERKSFVLFEEDIEKFGQTFLNSLLHFQGKDREKMIEELRKRHPNAFKPWSEEQLDLLKSGFADGETITALAEQLGRKEGAVIVRLKKLGLISETEEVEVTA